MVVVLPVPFTPTTRSTCGLSVLSISRGLRDWGEDGRDLVGESDPDFLVRHLPAPARASERGDALLGDSGTEIGRDQQLLQLRKPGLVEAALGDEVSDPRREFLRTARETLAQAGHEPKRHYTASKIS